MKTKTIKDDLIFHIKNALTRKFILLPFIAPCYSALFAWNYIGHYINDFFGTLKFLTKEQRAIYLETLNESKMKIDGKAIFAFYALTMTVIYWFVFGFSKELTGLEFLNFPTYFLTALPIEAVNQISQIKVHNA